MNIEHQEWRTCSACYQHYQGAYGECPKCAKQHAKKSNNVFPGNESRKGIPTLDIQEGTPEWNT